MSVVIQLVKLVDGSGHPYDEKYVESYDPTLRPPDDWIELKVTADPAQARAFPSFAEAIAYYRQVCPNKPVREDGLPNRPLTAWTVNFTTPR